MCTVVDFFLFFSGLASKHLEPQIGSHLLLYPRNVLFSVERYHTAGPHFPQ